MATIERYATKGGASLYRVRYRTPDHRSTRVSPLAWWEFGEAA